MAKATKIAQNAQQNQAKASARAASKTNPGESPSPGAIPGTATAAELGADPGQPAPVTPIAGVQSAPGALDPRSRQVTPAKIETEDGDGAAFDNPGMTGHPLAELAATPGALDVGQDFRPKAGDNLREMTIVQVLIKRGLEEIPGEVFAHEIPLLKLIHLRENVKVIDPAYSAVDVPDSAGAEWARLQNKYKQHASKLQQAFPHGAASIATLASMKDDTDAYGDAPQALNLSTRRKPGQKAQA